MLGTVHLIKVNCQGINIRTLNLNFGQTQLKVYRPCHLSVKLPFSAIYLVMLTGQIWSSFLVILIILVLKAGFKFRKIGKEFLNLAKTYFLGTSSLFKQAVIFEQKSWVLRILTVHVEVVSIKIFLTHFARFRTGTIELQ